MVSSIALLLTQFLYKLMTLMNLYEKSIRRNVEKMLWVSEPNFIIQNVPIQSFGLGHIPGLPGPQTDAFY